jgi:hypothetical protein
MNAIEKGFGQIFESITAKLANGIKELYDACALYVQKVDENPAFKDYCLEKMPSGPWRTFEQIGRNQLLPDLYLKSGVGFNYLKKLSYSDQKRFLNDPIEYLTAKNDTLKIEVQNLTPEQARQVFASNPPHLRTLAEQKAYRESAAVPTATPQGMPYEILRGGKVRINGAVFTLAQMHHICEEMAR